MVSIIFDTIPVKVFNYHDEFYTIPGIAVGDTQKVNIQSRDSLIQVVCRGKRYKPGYGYSHAEGWSRWWGVRIRIVGWSMGE